MSYTAPVTQLLLLPFFFAFTGVVRWVFIDDTSSAPGALGELYGKFGQYTLAFFPWDRAYSIAWLVIGMLIVLTGLARVALEATWSGSERRALDDVGWSDTLLMLSVFLVTLWYVPAIQVARPGCAGITSAVVANGVLFLATASAVTGVAMYDAWERRSVAVLLFGELAWGAYTGFLAYALVMSAASLVERCRFEPDPNWLYKRIAIPHKESFAQIGSVRKFSNDYSDLQLSYKPGTIYLPRRSSDTVEVPGAARLLGARKPSVDNSSEFKRSQIRAAQLVYKQSHIIDDPNWVAQGALRHRQLWATTAFKRWAGTFTRAFHIMNNSDAKLVDINREECVYKHVKLGDYELVVGVLMQVLLVGGLAVVVRSPTMPLLPFIAFNNLVPEMEGPRLFGMVTMVLSAGISLALGVARWVEA